MDQDIELLQRLYERFNARDIDGVLVALTDDVAWANGMDGGYVRGHDADGAIVAEVLQTVRDLDGNPLQGQTHGLKDKTVGHVFRFDAGKVARFDIQEAA